MALGCRLHCREASTQSLEDRTVPTSRDLTDHRGRWLLEAPVIELSMDSRAYSRGVGQEHALEDLDGKLATLNGLEQLGREVEIEHEVKSLLAPGAKTGAILWPMAPQDAITSLGSSLAALRSFLHIKQRALAKKAGISNAQLSRYENGNQVPNASTLHRILVAANVTPQDFYRLDALLREVSDRRESGPVPAPGRPTLRSSQGADSGEDADPDALAREAGRMLERVLRLHFKEIRARK